MHRSASIALSRDELGALPAPPRQCCPHRCGVRKRSALPWLCVLRQRACWMSRTRISPNKEDDPIVTAKQREFTTFLIILVHAAEVVCIEISVSRRREDHGDVNLARRALWKLGDSTNCLTYGQFIAAGRGPNRFRRQAPRTWCRRSTACSRPPV